MATRYLRSITLDHTLVSEDLTNFPVLLNFTDPTLKSAANGGHVHSADGYDITFTADQAGTQLLAWEVEKYDPTTGTFIAWVKVPTVSSTADTVIYLQYGSSAITSDQSNPGATWPSDYAGVWHLSNPSNLGADSTSNANNGTNHGATPSGDASIGAGSASFVAANSQYILVPDSPTLNPSPNLTLSGWVKPGTQTVQYSNAFGKLPVNDSAASYGFWLNGSANIFEADIVEQSVASTYALPTDAWTHIALTYDGSTISLYLNGSLNASASHTGAVIADPSYPFAIGANTTGSLCFQGLLAEIQLSSVARPAAYIAAAYVSQRPSSPFASLGGEQSASTSHAWTLTFSDGITPTDTIQRSSGKGVADTTSIGDSIIKAFAFVRFDATPVSDRIWKGTTRSSADVIPVSDSIRKATTKGFAERVSITETITKATSKAFSDTFIAADSIRRAIAKSFREAVSPSDSIHKAIGKRFLDTASIVDVFTYTTSMVVVAIHRFIARLAQRSWMAETKQRSFVAEVKQRLFIAGEEMYNTTKDPDEVSDFFVDFSDYIVAPDTIESSKWVVPAPMTLVQSSNTTTSCTGRLAGGVTGKNYQVAAEATLASGQVLVQRFRITIGPE